MGPATASYLIRPDGRCSPSGLAGWKLRFGSSLAGTKRTTWLNEGIGVGTNNWRRFAFIAGRRSGSFTLEIPKSSSSRPNSEGRRPLLQ